MHTLVKHITGWFGIVLLSLFFTVVGTKSIADQSVEEIIKGRKALFSKTTVQQSEFKPYLQMETLTKQKN